jgi:DNA-binding transcriptional ArsR family regulator
MRTDVFKAIADPTRRRILDLLAHSERAAGELVKPFHMSQPAVSQHLKVLRKAGLVTERRVGRERRYRLNARPLKKVAGWVSHYEQFWGDRLEALKKYLDEEEP